MAQLDLLGIFDILGNLAQTEINQALQESKSCSDLLRKIMLAGVGFEVKFVLISETAATVKAMAQTAQNGAPPFEDDMFEATASESAGQSASSKDVKPLTYIEVRQALSSVIQSFGRKNFTAAQASEKLCSDKGPRFDCKYVSLVLSKNWVPGINLARKRVYKGKRKINVYRRTR